MATNKRTDIHRDGALVPADYSWVLHYSLPSMCDGHAVPAVGVDCVIELSRYCEKSGALIERGRCRSDRCCLRALRAAGVKFAEHGGPGRCTACGANFLHGAVWKHGPTGEHIFLGHICSDKAEMFADRSEHELALDRARRAAMARLTRERNAEKRARFMAQHPGLADALKCEHHIVQDIGQRLQQYGSLSERQVALVLKIARETAERAAQPPEKHCAAPTGRVTFRGRVVSCKWRESDWGDQLKITVKVTEADGSTWLAWGTAPSGVLCDVRSDGGPLRGAQVEIRATLERGREPHFAFMKRPSGTVIEPAPAETRA